MGVEIERIREENAGEGGRMTREENNRKLAEWLGWREAAVDAAGLLRFWFNKDGRDVPSIDFYTDEAANALLLEKMPQPKLVKIGDSWGVQPQLRYGGDHTWNADRKTAICEAALKLIESKGLQW
jgi:hypothetical protein